MIVQNKTDLTGKKIGNYQTQTLLTKRKASNFYLAQDVKLDRPVFIEVLNETAEKDPDLVNRFIRRMESVAELKHTNIAPVIEIDTTSDGYAYAVIDHVAGDSLAQNLRNWNASETKLTTIEALSLSRGITDALTVAHSAGLIHHDLRPENIYVRESDGRPIVVDLGVPIVSTPHESALSNSRLEMLDYASPEEIEGKALSKRSNIYSLGILIYELLTGHRPELPASSWDIFERATMPKEVPLEEAREGLSGETYRLVRNCLWRQEWSRFETADELISAIDTAILAEETQPNKPAMWAARRNRWLYVAIPVIAVLVILFGLLVARTQLAGAGTGDPTAISGAETAVTPENGVSGTQPTIEPTVTNTREPLPTSSAPISIPFIEPVADSQFGSEDTLHFSWAYFTELKENEQFAVYIEPEDEVAKPILIGTVRIPERASVYALKEAVTNLPVADGSYVWQVRLEDLNTNEPLGESDLQRFFIILNTPTATATATALVSPTPQTPTATPTSIFVCTPTKPFGWSDHNVKAGESIATYAQRANVRVQTILDANCLEANSVLSIGQFLYIPRPLATSTPTRNPVLPTATPGIDNGGGSTKPPATTAPPTTPPEDPTSTPPRPG